MTYLNTGTFAIYLVPSLLRLLKPRSRKSYTPIDNNADTNGTSEERTLSAETDSLLSSDPSPSPPYSVKDVEPSDENSRPLTVRETAILSSQFCILWFLANLLSNASLSHTSVGSSTILTSTSSFFTLIVGSLFGVETITGQKVQALINSIFGLCLITYGTDSNGDQVTAPPHAWLGNLMALGSALIYGIYATMLKVRIGDYESRINMFHFFGFVGLFNIILLWPVIVIFNYTGVETFELPNSFHVWSIVVVNASISIISDVCWALAMLMTSPLVVTVGLSATIPLAIAGDMAINSRYGNFTYYLGAFLMVISIFRINQLENAQSEDERRHREN